MLDAHLKSPVTRRRLRTGPVSDHIDAFANWLHLQGYTPISIDCLLRSLAGWSDWMLTAGFTAQDLLRGLEACKLAIAQKPRVHCSRGPNGNSIWVASMFIRFLQQEGKLPLPVTPPSASEVWPLLGEYRSWMYKHRGLTMTTLDIYERTIVPLLNELGDDPGTYSAEALRAFVLDRARPYGIERAKSIVVAVRSFLRFLGVTGRCATGMQYAIPGFSARQLSSVPKFLVAEDVERVISSCPDNTTGLRDRAVLLLLARLGLRASEVAQLKFGDIDWHRGGITVCGKGRRQETLPLPQEVGDAILLYINEGRQSLKVAEVFVTVLAPFHALTRAAVTCIVRRALQRAGIKAAINGAHVLRHSAATNMLRQGASLAGVGAVLRHRLPSTTTLYAKVDFVLLSEIAQPWPGVISC